ncbi:hypothetical protein JXA12_05705 [Candidatus Woesearchaeota archaeon]|nr:hypothetical protein [Candidatus Woesearchaeota archaeon]
MEKVPLERLLVATLILLLIVVAIIGFLVVQQVRDAKDTGGNSAASSQGSGKVHVRISPEPANESDNPEVGGDTG